MNKKNLFNEVKTNLAFLWSTVHLQSQTYLYVRTVVWNIPPTQYLTGPSTVSSHFELSLMGLKFDRRENTMLCRVHQSFFSPEISDIYMRHIYEVPSLTRVGRQLFFNNRWTNTMHLQEIKEYREHFPMLNWFQFQFQQLLNVYLYC